MDVKFYSTAVEHNNLGTTLGSSIFRDALLPDLVGTDNTILYWAGKRLARNFPLAKDEDLPVFFEKANWGYLKRVKSKMNRQVFELSGPIVEIRKKINSKCEFLLEAGFIAETIQNQSGFTSEAVIDTETSRGNSVFITVQVDQRDPVDLNTIPDKDLLNPSREEL